MRDRLVQQGNQAGTLLPQLYDLINEGQVGEGMFDSVHAIKLSTELATKLYSDSNGIVINDEILNTSFGMIVLHVSSNNTFYYLRRTAIFDNSAIFTSNAIVNGNAVIINGYVSNGIIQVKSQKLFDNMFKVVALEIGNSEEIKAKNLKALNGVAGHFFTTIDYGYGVGTFQTGQPGFAHVTTAYGNEVFYDINPDGTITRNNTYVKPNEPYTVMLSASDIGVVLDSVTASHIVNAGEIVINGTTGPITYTRTSDSTQNMVYFTDDRKDGKITVISYNVSSKILSSVLVTPYPVMQNIADATEGTTVETLNSLLAELRNKGYIKI